MIFSIHKDIRIIPIALLLGCLVLTFSPLKPFKVAVSSQYSQLMSILKQNDMFYADLKIDFERVDRFSASDKKRIEQHLYFLDKHSSLYLLQSHYDYPISVDSINLSRLFYDFGLESD